MKHNIQAYVVACYIAAIPMMMVTMQDINLYWLLWLAVAPLYFPLSFLTYLQIDLSGSVGDPLVGHEMLYPLGVLLFIFLPALVAVRKRLEKRHS